MMESSAIEVNRIGRGVCALLMFCCVAGIGLPWPAQALTLTAEQMRLAQQLSPQEKARLAASAGLKPQESVASADTRYEEQVIAAEMKREKPEPVSAMEHDFSQRLQGGAC